MGLFDRLRGNDTPRVAFIGIDGLPHSLVSANQDTFPELPKHPPVELSAAAA